MPVHADDMGRAKQAANGHVGEPHAHQINGSAKSNKLTETERTDLAQWRLKDERGRQTWHYLESEEELRDWPQTTADRYHLGLPLNVSDLPSVLPAAKRPLTSAENGLSFFSRLQLPSGQWACEYGGPNFLLPGIVITWHVTQTPIPQPASLEIKRYLFARQNTEDGGWGLHIEGESSVFGTAMTYVALRLLGASEEDERMIKARTILHHLGGAIKGPHWAKFWMSVLGVMEWEAVNPVPPELWLLPDWVPIAPWRWWIHVRQVFLPMSFIYSKRFVCPPSPVTRQLREELYTQNYSSINFASHRNSISPRDNYHPKSFILHIINFILVYLWLPLLRTARLKTRAEAWTLELIRHEDLNTEYSCLAPVNAPLNTLTCYIHDGPGSPSVLAHLDRLRDYLWMKNEGMLCNGTNGVQTWDTSLLIQAVYACPQLASSPKWHPMLLSALQFLDEQQIRENCADQAKCYRQQRKGAWAFSTKTQGYTVSDTTSEALKAVLMLQVFPSDRPPAEKERLFPELVSRQRIHDAIDTLLTMQNPSSGGFASYEPRRGSQYLEYLNAAEVFGRIMVEYDYPECSTAVITALRVFSTTFDPSYRRADIEKATVGALQYIKAIQKRDGSWYGSWGICFTYAGMFALEALHSCGETYQTSDSVRRGCEFLVNKQQADGGWGESYRGCEIGEYVRRESQVVMTSWAVIGLLAAGYPDREVIERGVRLVMRRQQESGEWLQEGIEGVFNKTVMISYPNYKFVFPIKALGMFANQYGNEDVL